MILNWLIPILWIGSLYAQTNLEKGLIAYMFTHEYYMNYDLTFIKTKKTIAIPK